MKKVTEKSNENKKSIDAKHIDVLSYMRAISHNVKLIERLQKKLASLQEANVKMRNELIDHLNNGGEL